MEINDKTVTFLIKLQYKTKPGEEIYIYGDNKDFGNWISPSFKLNWSEGHVWQAIYSISKSIDYIKFKFVCHSKDYNIWEEGDNRLLSPKNIEYLPKSDDGKYILNCVWGYFKINFNIHYLLNSSSNMRIVGGIDALSNWKSPIKLKYDEKKILKAKDGNVIEGFWNITFLINSKNKKNYNFEYRYSVFDEDTKTTIWEREPNRHLNLLTEINDENSLNYKNNNDEYKLLTNSYLQILDVNFVADFIFNKMGEKNIYIGPYPQNKDDLISLSKSNINSILNVQSNGDLNYRQINLELLKNQSNELGIELNHYPINDFDSKDLLNKLKGAADLLNDLLKKGKIVYVHCTAGMSRAAATVIIYLVLYEDFNVETAKNFCKKYRPVICPNYDVINKVAKQYKPGSEMLEKINSDTNINNAWKKLREENDSPVRKEKKEDEYKLLRPVINKEDSIKDNKKLRKAKSKKKLKRLKSILKQSSLRKGSSHELGVKNGLTRSITFILDNDWDDRNIKRKESEKLRTRTKLNLEKKEIDKVKKNLWLELQKKNNETVKEKKFKKNKIKKVGGENDIKKTKQNIDVIKNKDVTKENTIKKKKILNNKPNRVSFSYDKNKIQNKISINNQQKTPLKSVKKNAIKKNNITLKNKEEDLVFSSMVKRLEKEELDSKKNNKKIIKENKIENKDENNNKKIIKDNKIEKKEQNKEINEKINNKDNNIINNDKNINNISKENENNNKINKQEEKENKKKNNIENKKDNKKEHKIEIKIENKKENNNIEKKIENKIKNNNLEKKI